MPFICTNYNKNRYTWKECTGNFVFILFPVKTVKRFCNMSKCSCCKEVCGGSRHRSFINKLSHHIPVSTVNQDKAPVNSACDHCQPCTDFIGSDDCTPGCGCRTQVDVFAVCADHICASGRRNGLDRFVPCKELCHHISVPVPDADITPGSSFGNHGSLCSYTVKTNAGIGF